MSVLVSAGNFFKPLHILVKFIGGGLVLPLPLFDLQFNIAFFRLQGSKVFQ